MTDIKNSIEIPEPLSGKYKDTFAFRTIADRLPVILTKAIDTTCRKIKDLVVMGIVESLHQKDAEQEIKEAIGRMAKLRNEMQTNKPLVELTSNSSDVKIWNQYLKDYKSVHKCDALWFEAQWLYVECYLYRRIREAFELTQYITSFDPFEESKRESLESSVPTIELLVSYLNSLEIKSDICLENEFIRFVELSLWGNKCDLSISSGNQNSQFTNSSDDLIKMRNKIVSNNLHKIWNYLKNLSSSSSSIRLSVVLDNAGFELFTDLCLIEFLQISGILRDDSVVKFYVKTIPWFVSDTMTKDFKWLLRFLSHEERYHSSLIKQLSFKWIKNIESGKWLIIEDDFWTLPHDFSQMKTVSPQLYQSLSEENLIIFKGDLNYRKLVGDLKWDFEVPFVTSLRGFLPTSLCTLRTIKCDLIVGVDDKQVLQNIQTYPNDWMETGEYALIQIAFK